MNGPFATWRMLIVGVNILSMVSCGLLDSHAPHSGDLGSEAYTAGDYKIGPEDVLEVNVWRNADLSKTVTVRPDGKISLPLVGDIQAMGLTAAELTKEVSERLKSFKESPLVSVVVQQINSYNVYFLGEVVRPGRQQFKAHTTILQAIISAGGFTQFASKNRIFVLRKLPGGGSEVKINVRYDDIVSGTDTSQNFVLLPGDTVIVP